MLGRSVGREWEKGWGVGWADSGCQCPEEEGCSMLGKRRRNGHGGGNKTNGFPTHTFTEGGRNHPSEAYSQKVTTTPYARTVYRHSQLLFSKFLGESRPEHTVSLTCRREVNCTSSTVRHGRRRERHCRLFPKEFVCMSPPNNVLPALSLSS